MKKTLLGVLVGSVLAAATVVAQMPVTVQLRDGTKINGRVEDLNGGTLFVRVSLHDQRRIAMADVALIDRVGGASGLPDSELREAAGAEHLLLMSNGRSVKGQLVTIRGGQGSAQENEARHYVFRDANGHEDTYPMDQVSRVYLGRYAVNTTASTTGPAAGVDAPGAIRVPASSGWVSTGLMVRRGERIAFNATGEVQLSNNPADRARAAGTPRTAPGAPLPTVNAGALLGRVGNGAPFGIGDQASVPMPDGGLLYLVVNDDERADNLGEFIVTVTRVPSY
jgi:hypothetical protein